MFSVLQMRQILRLSPAFGLAYVLADKKSVIHLEGSE
jgi:hypothetical protein